MKRRDFLSNLALLAAVGSFPRLSTKGAGSKTSVRHLSIGYFAQSHPLFIDCGRDYLNHAVKLGLISSYSLHAVSDEFLLSKVAAGTFDGALTSVGQNPWLPPEAQFLGAMPFGFSRDQKIAWMNSDAGRTVHEHLFAKRNLFALPVGIASDQYGFFSSRRIDGLESIKGLRMAGFDVRSNWWRALGAHVSPLESHDRFLLNSSRHVSDILPHHLYAFTAEAAGLALDDSKFTYYVTDRVKTAATLHLFWNRNLWESLSTENRGGFASLVGDSLTNSAAAFDAQQAGALLQIRSRASVARLNLEVENALGVQALKYQRLLALSSQKAALFGQVG